MRNNGEQLTGEGRALPTRLNPVLKAPPPYQDLVDNRRLGQTNLGEKANNSGPFSYVHLRVSLPQDLVGQELFGAGAPESYFLMRRSKDGFISSTGMFKASFPWAKKVEEETEKTYVKTRFPNTSKMETAGNLWVDPVDALLLAEEYGIKPWIEALLDNEPVVPSDHRKRSITPPPLFFRTAESDAGSVTSSTAPPSANTRRRSTRSMSPGKRMITPRKPRATKALAKDSPLKREVTPILEKEEEVATKNKTLTTTASTILSATPLTNGTPTNTDGAVSATTPVKKEQQVVKVEVEERVETNGDIEIKKTHVKFELPVDELPADELPADELPADELPADELPADEPPSAESTEEMLAKAREMVAKAKKLEGESVPVAKRKMEEIEDADDQVGEVEVAEKTTKEDEESKERKAKRTKVLEDQLRRERVKNRALLGLSATLALGALLPYVL